MIAFRYLVCILLTLACLSPLYAQSPHLNDEALSLSDTVETLNQDFHKAPVWRRGAVQVNERPKPLSDPSFSWAAGYIWDHPPLGVRTKWPPPAENFPAWTSNFGAEADPNGDMIAQIGEAVSPLTWTGRLNITARKMPSDLAASIGPSDPHGYLSGAITSFPFSQLYGVFSMSAKLPAGHGLWPAFWLLPADKAWPPEIDIMEVIGREPNTLYTTIHKLDKSASGHGTKMPTDLSAEFHEYTVDWEADKIDWYFDKKLVFSQPTPPELTKPCYILANLSVGQAKSWGGAPDETTPFPATMQIAYIRVWQRLSNFTSQPRNIVH
jgi:hypothetical protein